MTTSAQSSQGGANVHVPPPLVFLGLIGVGEVLQRWLAPVLVPVPVWPRVIIGALLASGGVCSVISARTWFKRTNQDPAPWRPSPVLFVQGIYRHTRNPMYVGVTAFQLGLGIALGNVWIASLSLLGLVIVHFLAVRPEEAYLFEKFGESYARYKATVRRYL